MAEILVSTWDEFAAAVQTSGAEVVFPSGGGTINMNDAAAEGISPITVRCASIEGNGWTIQGLHSYGINALTFAGNTPMSSLNFLDIYVLGGSLFYWSARTSNDRFFYNCQFSGEIFGGTSTGYFVQSGYTNTKGFDHCSMHLNLQGRATFNNALYSTTAFKLIDCEVILNGNLDFANPFGVSFVKSKLKGSLNNIGNTQPTVDFGEQSEASVVEIALEGFNTVRALSGAAYIAVNTDIIGGAAVSGGIISCNSEQIKSAQYLESQGFPIG